MRNKRGFTLIELLAVIVVLAIIITIATGSVISSINKSKEKAKFIAAKEIVEIAQAYMEENDVNVVTVKELKDANYLEDDATNPMTGNNNDLDDNYGVYKDTSSTELTDLQDSETSYHFNGYVFSGNTVMVKIQQYQDILYGETGDINTGGLDKLISVDGEIDYENLESKENDIDKFFMFKEITTILENESKFKYETCLLISEIKKYNNDKLNGLLTELEKKIKINDYGTINKLPENDSDYENTLITNKTILIPHYFYYYQGCY